MDAASLIGHWGYPAIFLVVVLGNAGFPVPEETILLLAGYLVWTGKLRLPLVLLVGILSAVVGDNLGYWIGREYGRRALDRYGHWILITPARLDTSQRLVTRYGPLAVFAARFLPGLRFLAGPVAGISGLRPLPFLAANILGACLYVPLAVAVGYAVGYGFGGYIAELERVIGQVERLVLVAAGGLTLLFLGWRAMRSLQAGRTPGRTGNPPPGI